MNKDSLILIVSDFHLGAGSTLPDGSTNFLEDFFHDSKFVDFLNYYAQGPYAKRSVELILNGDFFNHLQVYPDEQHPELMTEDVAFWRTEAIMVGHAEIFEALARFAQTPKHAVTFVIGNHDIALMWPRVADLVTKRLGPTVRVHRDPVYAFQDVWVEHGNQQVAENRINYQKLIVRRGERDPVINLPWGDLFVIHFLNRVKRERRYIDKVYPFRYYLRWAFLHDTWFAIRASLAGLWYFVKVFFQIGKHKQIGRIQFFHIAKEFSFPVRLEKAAARIFERHPDVRIVVFGHGHKAAAMQFPGGKEFYNTGIWNEMISLDPGTMGRELRLTFVEIRVDRHGASTGQLLEWKGAYREVESVGWI